MKSDYDNKDYKALVNDTIYLYDILYNYDPECYEMTWDGLVEVAMSLLPFPKGANKKRC